MLLPPGSTGGRSCLPSFLHSARHRSSPSLVTSVARPNHFTAHSFRTPPGLPLAMPGWNQILRRICEQASRILCTRVGLSVPGAKGPGPG
jgi:hypothetical protein